MADILGMMDYIRQQSDAGRQQGQQTRMADLYAQAMQAPADQRGNLLAQIARISPDTANSAQKSLSGMDAEAATGLAQEAGTFLAVAQMGDPATTQQAYMRLAQRARMAGHPVPDQFDERFLPGIQKLASAGQQTQELAPHVIGNALVDNTGKVLYQGQGMPKPPTYVDVPDGRGGSIKMQYDPESGGLVPLQIGGQQPAQDIPGNPVPLGSTLDPTKDYPQLAQAYGATTTSLYRTPQHNAEVGGVPNSQHLRGTAGDFVVPPAQRQQFIADARARGYQPINEGDHIHLQLPRGAHAGAAFGPRLGYNPPKEAADKGAYRTLSPQETQAMGLPEGTVAQVSPQGQVQIVNKPRDLPAGGQVVDNGDGTTTYIPAGKLSDAQRNNAGFYNRMIDADKTLTQLERQGYDPTNLRDQFTVGGKYLNGLASDQGQEYHQAAQNWVRANLRKESGAAIGVAEMDQEIRNYFPQIGDSPAVIAQKAHNRRVVEDAMRQAAAGALPPPATGPKQKPAANAVHDPLGIL